MENERPESKDASLAKETFDAQPFSRASSAALRYALFLLFLFFAGGVYAWYAFSRSDYVTGKNAPVSQPVLFSHRHHAGELGIDCRYCHASVDKGAFAGIPPTETCMTCHSQLFTDSPMLKPVRESFASGIPLAWNRVYDLPDYVYFDHSIHVAKGVDCASCHGDVAQMPLVSKSQPLYMEWCVDCHRQRTPSVYTSPESNYNSEAASAAPHPINPLTNCYACHR